LTSALGGTPFSRPNQARRSEGELTGGRHGKDHESSVKDDKQYEGLKKKGMSKERAAKIANTSNASSKGGKKSVSGQGSRQSSQSSGSGSGGNRSQKQAAGRKGGKKSS